MFTKLLHIVVRNIERNLKKNKPIYAILLLSFSLLFTLNTIVFSISDSYQTQYINYLTANYAISASQEEFTIFGSSLFLIGNFVLPSILNNIEQIIEIINTEETIETWTGLLTLPTLISHNDTQNIETISFGVDFESYFNVFSDIEIILGERPSSRQTEAHIILQESQYRSLGSPDLGTSLNIISADEFGVNFRSAILTGVFRYPIDEQGLNNVALVDANILRSLAGYVSRPRELIEISENDRKFLSTDIDNLFSPSSEPQSTEDAAFELGDLDSIFANSSEQSIASSIVESAWHFLLIQKTPATTVSNSAANIRNKGITAENGYKILNWRETAGGNAQLLYFLTVIINIGTGILILGTVLIILNSLMLSILERSWEIATMRAIGASKHNIVSLISAEVLITMILTSILGIAVGVLTVLFINSLQITLTNDFLNNLFANMPIVGNLSTNIVIAHIIFAIFLAIFCAVYPLFKVLRISPQEALL